MRFSYVSLADLLDFIWASFSSLLHQYSLCTRLGHQSHPAAVEDILCIILIQNSESDEMNKENGTENHYVPDESLKLGNRHCHKNFRYFGILYLKFQLSSAIVRVDKKKKKLSHFCSWKYTDTLLILKIRFWSTYTK